MHKITMVFFDEDTCRVRVHREFTSRVDALSCLRDASKLPNFVAGGFDA